MQIPDIKNQLSILTVLSHYGLKPNKNNMLNCPFHEDKTPSMQVYPKTNTVYCFSSNCKTHGKSLDVIDLIMHQENCTKHKAILKAKAMIGHAIVQTISNNQPTMNYQTIFKQLRVALPRSKKAVDYLKSRNLYNPKLEIGSNHQTKVNGKTSYLFPKLKNCIVFPLKDKDGNIVSLYGRSLTKGHYYTSNRKGLYPEYPNGQTKAIALTESIIDAATINTHTNHLTLAFYGTNGLREEHRQALKNCPNLKEIIFFFDGDKSGREGVEKYAKELHTLLPQVTISQVSTPEGEDPNSLIQSHETEILTHLIDKRTKLFLSSEKSSIEIDDSRTPSENKSLVSKKSLNGQKTPVVNHTEESKQSSKLNTSNEQYITFKTDNVLISILGGIALYPLDKLRVTLKIERIDTISPLYSLRHSLDLYHDDQTDRLIRKASERLETGSKQMQLTIAELIQELESYRQLQIKKQKPPKPEKRILNAEREQRVKSFLKRKDLMEATDKLIEQSGVVGEKINRQILWYVYTTRLRKEPLHVICLGASGTGKTYLQERITELIPEESKVSGTTMSENALYYAQNLNLPHKLFIIEDLDGASNVLYSLRELQTKSSISKMVTHKDNKGNFNTIIVAVQGPICLTGTTTKEKLYEDNANRCLLIYLDGGKSQRQAIMSHQCKRSAGKVDKQKERSAIEFLRDVQSLLGPITIRNPYAEDLHLPETVFKPLRTNAHYLAFIEAITFYHQWQRQKKKTPEGVDYIETTLGDIAKANELLKDVLLAKSDELTKACRNFFERVKSYVQQKNKGSFYRRDVRDWMRINPNNLRYYLKQLAMYGYLNVLGCHKQLGHEYEIADMEEYQRLNGRLHTALDHALVSIRNQTKGDS